MNVSDATGSAASPEPEPLTIDLCAGIPCAGERPLTSSERRQLATRAVANGSIGCFLPIVVPVITLLLALWIGNVLTPPGRDPSTLVLSVLFVMGIFACAIALLRGSEFLEIARKALITRRRGVVRRFEGTMGMFDPTNLSMHALLLSGLVEFDRDRVINVELYPHLDEVYSANGALVGGVIKMPITTAVPRPIDPVVWTLPSSWIEGELPVTLERRRPTPEEAEELKAYTRIGPGRWARVIAYAVLFVPAFGYILFILEYLLAAFWYGAPNATTDPLDFAWRVQWLAPVLSVIVMGTVVIRGLRIINRMRRDIAVGWILVISPPSSGQPAGQTADPSKHAERLPISLRLWTLGGKPAGWRRHPNSGKR